MFKIKAINQQPGGKKITVYLQKDHLMGWCIKKQLATRYTEEEANRLVAKWSGEEYGKKEVVKISTETEYEIHFQTWGGESYINRHEMIIAFNQREAKQKLLNKHPDASSIKIYHQ